MSLTLHIAGVGKRKNSTYRQEFNSSGLDVELKEDTSFNRPVFRVTANIGTNIQNYNYAYLEEWNAYYWIDDITITMGNIWEVSCSLDVLATYKDAILRNRVYVLRSASQYDGTIVDNYYPMTAGLTTVRNSYTPPLAVDADSFDLSWSHGYFVAGIIGGRASASGCVSYYAFSYSQFITFCNWLFAENSSVVSSIEDFSEEAAKVLYNPIQYVASVMWFPLPMVNTTGTVSSIPIGWWSAPVSASSISITPAYPTIVINVTQHPQSAARGNFLNLEPFTERILSYWPYGEITLKNPYPALTKISIREILDYVSGKGRLMVWGGDWSLNPELVGSPIAVAEAQKGVPVSLAQITTDQVGAIQAGATQLSGISLLNPVSWFSGAVSGIAAYTQQAAPQVQKIGTQGGLGDLLQNTRNQNFTLTEYFHTVADDDLVRHGRPLCKPVLLSTLSGFTQCDCTGIQVPCSDEDHDEIINYLNTGFFIE